MAIRFVRAALDIVSLAVLAGTVLLLAVGFGA
jgi:hypothetical protein